MQMVWRRLTPQEIDHEQLWLAVSATALVALALTSTHVLEVQLPLCPFKTITGLPCPTCGVTRAVMAMTRLDFVSALAFNPLAVAAAIAGGLYLAYAAAVLLARLPRFRPRLAPRDLVLARVVTILVLSANWLYLVLAGR
jgi:Protein of unknown function (DUF2752)